MKQRLRIIKNLFLALCWALHFRIFRLVDFIQAYLVIERSRLFDSGFYRESLAIADRNRRDPYPLVHYLAKGAGESKDPHRIFHTRYYCMRNPDVIASGMNPLVHFIVHGSREARNPHPLFDTAYYLRKHPDAVASGVNPLAHYLEFGLDENRSPNPLFDTAYYLRRNPDVVASGMNPLAHFIVYGSREARNPHPLFDTAYYVRKHPDAAESGLNPLAHYLEFGLHENGSPGPLFDAGYYLRRYPDVAEAGMNPLLHYLECGACEDRNPNPLFDSAFYRNRYADVMETGGNPLFDYLERGSDEGRHPNPLFDTAYYLRQYPDVAEAGMNPLAHFIEFGSLDGRKPNPLFDTAYYLRRYPDIAETGVNPLAHYIEDGAWDDRKPNPLFDSAYYLRRYPDVAGNGIHPLIHYLSYGVREGRKPNPFFDTKYYLEKNPEVVAASENPLAHYLEKGAAEGREPGPDFDTVYYSGDRGQSSRAGWNALVHYLEIGSHEGLYPRNVYEDWIRENRLTDEDRKKIWKQMDALSYRPTFSLIMPVYNTDERWLRRCLDSVMVQLYPDWELCIADDASTDPTVREVLEEYKAKETRIRVVFRRENGHICASSNSALEMATGEFIALLDHDDELAEHALYENAILLNEHQDADMIYSDEDKLGIDGKRHTPFFKPDWSPDTFLSHMYTCHLGVYRTELVRDIGGFRVGYEGSQDYDLVLRLAGKTEKIYHIPKILYHWRAIPGSTAMNSDSKNYAYEAGRKAIREALDRRGEGGWVENIANYSGQYLVHYRVPDHPLISIVIPAKDHSRALDRCLRSIFTKTLYDPFEVIVLDNGSVPEETRNVLMSWKRKEHGRLKIIRPDVPCNFSRLINEGVRQAQGSLIALLHDDVEALSECWLAEMAGQARRQSIGAVGAFLFYSDRTIQHAGLILGVAGPTGHGHRYAPENSPGYRGRLLVVSNYAAVTGACLMVKKQLFMDAGGLDEDLAAAYNDVDFCLRLLKMGYRNVVLPQARLLHHESRNRGSDRMGENRIRPDHEAEIIKKRWAVLIENDPYYNPNLTRDREDFTLGFFSPGP